MSAAFDSSVSVSIQVMSSTLAAFKYRVSGMLTLTIYIYLSLHVHLISSRPGWSVLLAGVFSIRFQEEVPPLFNYFRDNPEISSQPHREGEP